MLFYKNSTVFCSRIYLQQILVPRSIFTMFQVFERRHIEGCCDWGGCWAHGVRMAADGLSRQLLKWAVERQKYNVFRGSPSFEPIYTWFNSKSLCLSSCHVPHRWVFFLIEHKIHLGKCTHLLSVDFILNKKRNTKHLILIVFTYLHKILSRWLNSNAQTWITRNLETYFYWGDQIKQ